MPDEEMNIEKLAEYASKFFKTKTRGEGREAEEFYKLEDRHPTWLYDMMFAVHDKGQWRPDDYKYEFAVQALDHLSNGMNPEEPELEADIYTSDLMKWFASHLERAGIVDEAVKEFGWDDEKGIVGAIALGQWREKEEVFQRVVEALNERLEAIELGEEEEFKGRAKGVLDWEPE